ncbi:lyase family protein [Streptomyces omiyaensis]|uniref:Lyase family protein n=1 Tax=Streptomyces omiyaensis TaxID=68247 RepID=A0ABW7C1A9_9ACTN
MARLEPGRLPEGRARAVIAACREIREGRLHDQFAVDVLQGGAGTPANTNADEVIANGALELTGHARGSYAELGRARPQDAVPMPLGREFDAFALTVRDGAEPIGGGREALLEVTPGERPSVPASTPIPGPRPAGPVSRALTFQVIGVKPPNVPPVAESSRPRRTTAHHGAAVARPGPVDQPGR